MNYETLCSSGNYCNFKGISSDVRTVTCCYKYFCDWQAPRDGRPELLRAAERDFRGERKGKNENYNS